MNIVVPALFWIAALAAIVTIWKSVIAALPVLKALHAQLNDARRGHAIHVRTLERKTRREIRRPLKHAHRHPHPKPVTHRLHQFPHRSHMA